MEWQPAMVGRLNLIFQYVHNSTSLQAFRTNEQCPFLRSDI